MGELSDVERTAGLAGIYLVGGPLRGGEKFVRADALLLPESMRQRCPPSL